MKKIVILILCVALCLFDMAFIMSKNEQLVYGFCSSDNKMQLNEYNNKLAEQVIQMSDIVVPVNEQPYSYKWNNSVLEFTMPIELEKCTIKENKCFDYLAVHITYEDCMIMTIYVATQNYYNSQIRTWEGYENFTLIDKQNENIAFVLLPDTKLQKNPEECDFPFSQEICKEYKSMFNYTDNVISSIRVDFSKMNMGETEAISEDSKTNMGETETISEDELKAILLDRVSEPIVNFIYDDFDNNGVYEGIAFCGEHDDFDGSYFGTLYFVTQNGIQIMKERGGYWNSGEIYDFGNTKIIEITQYFTTGGISYCYEIEGTTFKEIEGSGWGNMFQDEQGCIYMTDSQYDAMVDGTGHTWNRYYFYWDNGLWEYGGTEISKEKFAEYNGANGILDKISADGYDITSIYRRENGIININCCDGYSNVNVRVFFEGDHVKAFPITENYFYEEGIIKSALIPQIATYVKKSVELKAYTAFPESTIGINQDVKIQFSLYENENITPIKEYSLDNSNPSVIQLEESIDSDGSKIITFKGLKVGYSDLTFTDNSTGATIILSLSVEDKCNYFRCSAFPIPYESIGSIYVADYTCTVNEKGGHDILFDAYNTSYAYGIVEVYDEDDNLIRVVPLDPRSDGSGMEKVVNGFKWVWEDIKNIFDGDTPFYTKESNAKHTPVKLENIPENAEIIVTSDGNKSDLVTIYTGVDVFVRTVCAASSIDLKYDGQITTVKELMNALVDSLVKSVSNEETEKMIKQGLIKESAKNISTAIAFSPLENSISDIYDTIYNLFQSLNIDVENIVLNVLKGMGYSVADELFTTVVPHYKIVNCIDQILETAWPLTDYRFNDDRGKMEIHVNKHGIQNFVANSSVMVTQQSNFSDNTVLDAYVVINADELEMLSDSITEEISDYTIYNITLREDGMEIQPNEEIEVRLPIPNDTKDGKYVVYRIEEDGDKMLLESSCDEGYITFKTSHLSYYIVGLSASSVVTDNFIQNNIGIVVVVILSIGCTILVGIFMKNKKCRK